MPKNTEVEVKTANIAVATAQHFDSEAISNVLNDLHNENVNNWEVESALNITLEKGQGYIFFVHGIEQQEDKDGQKYEAVKLTDRSGATCFNSDVVFVSTISRNIEEGNKVPGIYSVYWDGTIKGTEKKREYKALSINRKSINKA